jgi:hypothetical protein
MESIYGRNQVRRFLKYELDAYLRVRGGDALEELPLARVEDQKYIYYQKGSLAMYWAKEVLGEGRREPGAAQAARAVRVQGAAVREYRRLPRPAARRGRPRERRADRRPVRAHPRSNDLKASGATAKKRADGKYDLSFVVEAKKFPRRRAGRGNRGARCTRWSSSAPSRPSRREGLQSTDVLVLGKQRIDSGRTFVPNLVVDRPPTWVGIDPYNKCIDRNSDDNVVKVELK